MTGENVINICSTRLWTAGGGGGEEEGEGVLTLVLSRGVSLEVLR